MQLNIMLKNLLKLVNLSEQSQYISPCFVLVEKETQTRRFQNLLNFNKFQGVLLNCLCDKQPNTSNDPSYSN